MSEKDDKKLIHPVTAAIVRHMERANLLLQKGEYVESLKAMRGVITFMEKGDVPAGLHTKIRQEPHRILSSQSMRQQRRHAQSSEAAYWKWLSELNEACYEKGYYTMDKWPGFHDPSGGRKSQ